MYETLQGLREFGARSLLVHVLMSFASIGAIGSAFLLSGDLGLVSFVALVNFAAGLWVSHSIHSLGNTFTEDEYDGIVAEL